MTDGLTLGINDSDQLIANASVRRWFKVTQDLAYTVFSTAATTQTALILTLPAGGIITGVKIKHRIAYAGTGITAYTLSVGISGVAAKYATAYDVLGTPVSESTFQISTGTFSEDHTNSTPVIATATSTGAFLNQATAGVADIWIEYAAAV